jgi:ribosomal protein L16/L10AE
MKKKKQNIHLPKKTKFKKLQKGYIQPIERKKSITQPYYGIYGLKVLMHSRLNHIQLEAARRQISRGLKKQEFL